MSILKNKKKKESGEPLYHYCEGIGCTLRDRCQRYVNGRDIDPHAEGYSWITSCSEEERPMYIPVTNLQTA